MPIKVVLLDLDGTLRDTRQVIYSAYQQAIKVHSGRDVTNEEIKPHVHHHTVVHKAFADHVTTEEFEQTYVSAVHPAVENSALYPGAKELVETLSAEGYKLAIVTSAFQKRAELYLEINGLADKFQVVVGMMPDRQPKPSANLVEIALKQLNCGADQAIMLGDMTVDIQAAHGAGVRCVGITHGFASRQELESAGADYIIDSLGELPDILSKL